MSYTSSSGVNHSELLLWALGCLIEAWQRSANDMRFRCLGGAIGGRKRLDIGFDNYPFQSFIQTTKHWPPFNYLALKAVWIAPSLNQYRSQRLLFNSDASSLNTRSRFKNFRSVRTHWFVVPAWRSESPCRA